MKKAVSLILILLMTIMVSTSAFAININVGEKEKNSQQESESLIVTRHLNKLGFKDLPDDAVYLMQKGYTVSDDLSDWDVLVQFAKNRKSPEGVQISIEDGYIEFNVKSSSESLKEENIVQPKSTYTVFSKKYDGVKSHLYVGNGYLSAFQGRYYWILHYRTGSTIHQSISYPGGWAGGYIYDGSSTVVKHRSGTVCHNPSGGDWSYYIACQDPQGAYLYARLMKEN